VDEYSEFLEDVQNHYHFIMKQCAPKISQLFTEMTSVINEGNSYEFPSIEIHKAIIVKLIFNEKNFKKVFAQLKE